MKITNAAELLPVAVCANSTQPGEVYRYVGFNNAVVIRTVEAPGHAGCFVDLQRGTCYCGPTDPSRGGDFLSLNAEVVIR